MCYLCDKIYTEDMFNTEQDDRDPQGDYYILKEGPTSLCTNTYYYLYSHYFGEEDEEIMEINYCPECGKQLFYDKYYHGTVLNNPKVKIIKIGE